MELEYLMRLEKMNKLNEEEFLHYVMENIAEEFKEFSTYIYKSMDELYVVGLENYKALISFEEIIMLKDEADPFGLDRFILAHYLVEGLTFEHDKSDYIRNIFHVFKGKEELEIDIDDSTIIVQ